MTTTNVQRGYKMNGLSISQHFEMLGPCFSADTETAMAPKAFEGRDCVRLFQAYNEPPSGLTSKSSPTRTGLS